MTIIMLVLWDANGFYALIFFIVFIIVEGSYLSVVLWKIPDGGWLPFMLSVVFTSIMAIWNYGRQKKFDFLGSVSFTPTCFMVSLP
jgi:KUP system potassium uptake protein